MRRESHASRCASTRTLVTGFSLFGSFAANPSSQLATECGRPFEIMEVSYSAVDQFLSQLPAESFDRLVILGIRLTKATTGLVQPEVTHEQISDEAGNDEYIKKAAHISVSRQKPGNNLLSRCFALSSAT